MIDWTKSMTQSFEYFIVDPITWKDMKKIDAIKSSTINRDADLETLGSASIEIDGPIEECYIRIYMTVIQNGVNYKLPLGTYLIQPPSTSFDGKKSTLSADAYTPLIELKENQPPIGYYIAESTNIMERVYALTSENCRAPTIQPIDETVMDVDFVAGIDESWLAYLKAAMENAKFKYDIDELGNIAFAPNQEVESMQPRWTYTDDNSSILYPSITVNHDIYTVPNVVEVVYSGDHCYHGKAINNDPNSPVSTYNRGRMLTYRVTDPSLAGEITEERVQEYAKELLEALSSVEYTISYTHGYCPVRVGDCVRISYKRAGLENVKAKVIRQSIECKPGCKVTETAAFTAKLWEG